MSAKAKTGILTCVLLLTALGTPAGAQDASLTDQLKAQYKLAKMGSDSSGISVVEPGTALVIQKGGILGVPPTNAVIASATYKDHELHGPNAFLAGMVAKISRQLSVGEKVYVTKIDVRNKDVHAKNDKVTLYIVECDSCNNVQQPSSFVSAVAFEFPKDYLSKADVSQVEDVISEVLAPDTASNNQQQAQAQQPSPSAQGTSEPPTIQIGQTVEQVKEAWGPPDKVVDLGKKQIYVYKDLKITFIDGKVADVQ